MPRAKSAGQLLIADLAQPDDRYALTVMIVEAARIADRLQKLDQLLCGQQTLWARLRENREGDIYVSVDNALSEARQQATVLRHLIAEVHRQRAQNPGPPPEDDLAGL
ncbi:hypothetical protein AWC11_07250 [Mycobacterium interjectum]|nr:hypothetical protein AWC11_07250 [Mycobacterium interjectum]